MYHSCIAESYQTELVILYIVNVERSIPSENDGSTKNIHTQKEVIHEHKTFLRFFGYRHRPYRHRLRTRHQRQFCAWQSDKTSG